MTPAAALAHPTQQQFQVTKYGTAALVGNGYKSRMGASATG